MQGSWQLQMLALIWFCCYWWVAAHDHDGFLYTCHLTYARPTVPKAKDESALLQLPLAVVRWDTAKILNEQLEKIAGKTFIGGQT